ncbi:MAG: xylulokinase [Rhizobacter sp.]
MYLGIDLGTSEVKLLLLADTGAIVASAGVRLDISRPQPGWSEQDPQAWWAATVSAASRLRAEQPEAWAKVRAVGLSGQMHGAVLLDASGEVLRPAILWNDVRSAAECGEMMATMPSLPAISGNLAMPGFTAPKLAWVRKHEPAIFARVAKVLLPKDYLRYRLCGSFVGEMSDAAGTLWLDVAARRWSDELLALTGLSRSHMPELVEGSASSGTVRDDIAAAWGLPRGVVVAGGGGDNAASAVGIGAVRPGEGFVSLGTSGVVFVVNDRFRPNPASAVHAFCHAVPGRWHQMSVMLSAASSLAWATKLTGASGEAELLSRMAALPESAHLAAPLFLPYLSGERTPHNDANARGVLFGLTHDTDPASLAYAVLEGVAFGMRDGLDALRAAGTEPGRLAVVGGGARSAFWVQLHADLFGVELVTLDGGETGGALGAARLAWLADGAAEDDVCRLPLVRQVFSPDPARAGRLADRLDRFRALYTTLRPSFSPS